MTAAVRGDHGRYGAGRDYTDDVTRYDDGRLRTAGSVVFVLLLVSATAP